MDRDSAPLATGVRAGRKPTVVVTGGAGFIGSAVVRRLVSAGDATVVTVDKLTYSGNLANLAEVADDPGHHFVRADICDRETMTAVFEEFRPDAVLHLAAESHVDRSIDGPGDFIETNIRGTYVLLQATLKHWRTLEGAAADRFRFVHVSTDEVFGSLGDTGFFVEDTPYDPRSPYSASKAASDHLARAWHHTYALPVVVTNTCNNYGPYQYPEKLIPLAIHKALGAQPIPVYGKGENVRDWIYVDDHVEGILAAWDRGMPGSTYNLGARSPLPNLELVRRVCRILDEVAPNPGVTNHESLIQFVSDRPGHDWRYAIDPTKAETDLGWLPRETFETGIRRTVRWYLDHQDWVRDATAGKYGGERLGLGAPPS